jgi:chemotaxis protein MotA
MGVPRHERDMAMTGKWGKAGRIDPSGAFGLVCALAVLVAAQWLEGGHVRSLIQPTAAVVVFGGTLAALLVSFPVHTLWRTARAVGEAFTTPPRSLRSLVAEMTSLATRSKRKGLMSLEAVAVESRDAFLGRAAQSAADGMAPDEVRRAMEAESDLQADSEEEPAIVLEAAAGYAPTLGILGAVLGLIHVMENLAAPSKLGSGIAVAFVATVYGVGWANLILLPLAARLRLHVRLAALRREIVIESVIAMLQGVHPRMLEEQLNAYVRGRDRSREDRRAA